MFLVVAAHAPTMMMEIFVGEQNNTNHSITDGESERAPILISSWLILAAELTGHVGLYVTLFTTVEFTNAQSPCQNGEHQNGENGEQECYL